jgi:hypothetical protein
LNDFVNTSADKGRNWLNALTIIFIAFRSSDDVLSNSKDQTRQILAVLRRPTKGK